MSDNNNTSPAQPRRLRTIRSFVRREGRLTAGQQRALQEQLPVFGLNEKSANQNLNDIFQRNNPKILEIGFGNGDSLAQQAADNPDNDYIGIEVHRPGVGHLLVKIKEMALTNVRIFNADAVEVLKHCIADQSLEGIQIYFPDPWHKKKHHKRRLVQTEFIALLGKKLNPGGTLHLATDWENYAEHMVEVMQQMEEFKNTAAEGNFVPRPTHRPFTKFEQRGQRLGHGVWDLIYQTE